MPLTGDSSALARLVSKLETVGEVPKASREQLASTALHRVLMGFSTSKEPGGAAWDALKYRQGRPLVDTGKLRGSMRSRITAGGIVLTAGASYAVHHQFGAPRANVPARPFFPRDGELPSGWRGAFERIIDQTLSGHFR